MHQPCRLYSLFFEISKNLSVYPHLPHAINSLNRLTGRFFSISKHLRFYKRVHRLPIILVHNHIPFIAYVQLKPCHPSFKIWRHFTHRVFCSGLRGVFCEPRALRAGVSGAGAGAGCVFSASRLIRPNFSQNRLLRPPIKRVKLLNQ